MQVLYDEPSGDEDSLFGEEIIHDIVESYDSDKDEDVVGPSDDEIIIELDHEPEVFSQDMLMSCLDSISHKCLSLFYSDKIIVQSVSHILL